MNLNLGLLIPEWVLLGTLTLMMVRELFAKSDAQGDKSPFTLASLGVLAVFFSVLPFAGQIGSAFGGMFLLDPFASFFKAFFALTAFGVIRMSRRYFENESKAPTEYLMIILCTLIGLFVLVSANHFLLLFVALEIVTLSFYILASYHKKSLVSIEAGLKYFILGSLSSALMIYGISLLYIHAGTLDFVGIKTAFQGSYNSMMGLALLLLISGLGFKVASVPFQLWVPDVYEGAPTPTVSFLSVASKSAGFAILLRLIFTVVDNYEAAITGLFAFFAVMTLLYGNLGALLQTNIKRLFGYSSIGHAGYLLIGIATGGLAGTRAVLFYILTYGITTLTVFYIITLCYNKLGSHEITAYRGLSQKSPFLAGIFFIALLSSAGVPPLAGFSGKFFILLAAVGHGLIWLAVLGAVIVAVSLYFYLNVVKEMYFNESSHHNDIEIDRTSKILLTILAIGIIVIGIWQHPFMSWAENAATYLF